MNYGVSRGENRNLNQAKNLAELKSTSVASHRKIEPNFSSREIIINDEFQSEPITDSEKIVILNQRRKLLNICFALLFLALIWQFFNIQITYGPQYSALAQRQYFRPYSQRGQRGKIFSQDGSLLVSNCDNYKISIDNNILRKNYDLPPVDRNNQILLNENQKNTLHATYEQLSFQLAPIFYDKFGFYDQEVSEIQQQISSKLKDQDNKKFINLTARATPETKAQLTALNYNFISYDTLSVRTYPEASLAAQIVGYVARDAADLDIGYAGIEGALDKELQGKTAQKTIEVDAHQSPLNYQNDIDVVAADGRDVYLTIRRDIQNYLELTLADSLLKYGAQKGEIIVMNPHTGAILGWATLPSYNPDRYNQFPKELLHNPSLSDQFEPGSTFKVFTVSAGIDTGKISPYTTCTRCATARKVADATIKTWNDEYHPNISMIDALAKSDNTAMVFITDLLGADSFKEYLQRFKFGEPIGFEMQEDNKTLFPGVWRPVELATRSFGQGIMVNSMQMMRGVGAIANGGQMMRPQIVSKVIDRETNIEYPVKPEVVGQPITASTAQQVTMMMKSSAKHGEAQYIYKNSDIIAGKTGTAQIADENGGYKSDETLHSFIGFAPADDPEFVMLVKLTAPKSSPWAAETAAPLWNKVAHKLFIFLGIDAQIE